ncbi:MAG TPA: UbiA family prenyltransferase [Microbacterium sp.]|uniref:UbiA family prenyltransferase n=1 Tax=Microbacterium sp. TaxID=51671 RepID=UPI002CD82C78|nr:UbiA family prenyltransferase [Microbacterium sp.]HWI30594.1 UbiA family prenyltransferase [Microbacterium sp.]
MRIAAALWRSSHPGPTVVVTVLALALGASVGVDAGRLAVLVASVLLGQLSIGISNDVIDAPRDRISGRTDKPLARGDAPTRVAWIAAWSTLVGALALSALLGWQLALAHAIFVGSGWAYNAWLKSTVFSAACFVIGFGVFPSLAPLALPDPHAAPPWAWIAGAALGLAVHFSNVLPDLEDDARTGVRGLPHRLGRRASAGVAAGALITGATAVVVGSAGAAAPTVLSWGFFAAVVGVAVWGLVAALTRPPERLVFRLVMAAALLLAAQLVLAGNLGI